MTEAIFASAEAFIRHTEATFCLTLSDSDKVNVRLLHALDPSRLRKVHWRLDNEWESSSVRSSAASSKGKAKSRDGAELAAAREKAVERFRTNLGEAAKELDVPDTLSQDIEDMGLDSASTVGSASPTRAMSMSPVRPPLSLNPLQTPKSTTASSALNCNESPTKTVRPFSRTTSANDALSASPLLGSSSSSRAFARTKSASSVAPASNCRPGGPLEPGSPTKRARAETSAASPSVKLGFMEPYDVTSQARSVIERHLESSTSSVPWALRIWLASLVSSNRLDPKTGEPFTWSSLSGTDWRVLRESDGMTGAAYLSQKLGLQVPLSVQKALREGDFEEKALSKDQFAGLGFEVDGGWYGGKVHFEARVKKHAGGGFYVTVGPPKTGGSNRFARRFGSSSFLRLGIDEDCKRGNGAAGELQNFLRRPFLLLGKRFVPCYAREKFLFLLRLDEGCPFRRSLYDFLDWHGPFRLNKDGGLLKFMQRSALGLSTSVPGIKFEQSLIKTEEDKEGAGVNGRFNPPACLTDGASFMSASAMVKVARTLELKSVPAAVQARFGGAKGVWFIRSETDKDPRERIYLRPSQTKLRRYLTEDWDPANLYLDVIGPARLRFPSSLSQQILFVLSHNGVPTDVFVELQRKQIRDVFEQMATLSKGDGHKLALLVDQNGGITSTWARNAAAHEARAKGLASRQAMEEFDDGEAVDDDEGLAEESSQASTKAASASHVIYDMLMAGFDPTESSFLIEKLSQVSRFIVDKLVKKFQIPLGRSTELLVIPDDSGKLEPGQISVSFSRPDQVIDPDTRMSISHLVGDVLVTRHPCLLPTDIQKVTAVVVPELAHHHDCVVFSTKGNRSLADLLSGGDYDGDLVRIIFEPSIVEPFKNAHVSFSVPPKDIEKHFEKDTVTVEHFLKNVAPSRREEELIRRVVKPITAMPQAGIYGILHRNSAYLNGCGHPWTVQLAHKFAAVLDGSKTGVSVSGEWMRKDRQAFDCAMPDWAEKDSEDLGDFVLSSKMSKPRNPNLPPSIHDKLAAAGREEAAAVADLWRKRLDKTVFSPDEDLMGPWREACEKGRLGVDQLRAIKDHVDKALEHYASTTRDYARAKAAQSSSMGFNKAAIQSSVIKFKAQREQTTAMYRRWRSSSAICGVAAAASAAASRPGLDVKALASSSTTSLSSTTSSGLAPPPSRPVSPATPLSTTSSSLLEVSAWGPPSSSASNPSPAASLDRLERHRLGLIIASCAYTACVEASQRRARQRGVSNGSSTASLTVSSGENPSSSSSSRPSSSSHDRFEAKFAFEVALDELCDIKAQSTASRSGERPKMLPPTSYRAMRINRQVLLGRGEAEEADASAQHARRGSEQLQRGEHDDDEELDDFAHAFFDDVDDDV